MAAISRFPIFQSREFISVHLTSPHYNLPSFSSRNSLGISVSSTRKPRSNRKVKNNVELVNDLREFISMAGLPLDHVPSTKELSEHGRQDLANIVRRRGYKFIRQLLADHLLSATIAPRDLEGQNTSAEDLADAICLSNETSNVVEEQTDNFSIDNVVSNELSDVEEDHTVSTVTNDDKISGEDEPESSCTSPTSPDSRSVSEKVDKFLEDGELGNVEDRLFYSVGGVDEQTSSPTELLEQSSFQIDVSSTDSLSYEEPTTSCHSKELHVEFKADNQDEIDRLKFLLRKKELELTHLKEQIEEEKLALSILQCKAESELNKAQKLILEKDTVLNDAENSLSGLKEVEIQFCGEGDNVEVAGSFNGWHHMIKMDIQPCPIDSGQSKPRNCGLWKTTLWLYPGVYEIKFIIDGHWMINSQMESINKGAMHNNILRVDNK